MFNTTSKELYSNLKPNEIPPRDHPDRPAFVQWEKDKSLNGVTINGQFIPGGFYYHFNHHAIARDVLDHTGRNHRIIGKPLVRDNDWLIFSEYDKAALAREVFCMGGARQLGKDLLNTSKLYTETGEIEIGSAQVGQQIYGADGKLTTITGVYPQGIKPVYEVSLADGRKVYCGLDHNWYVWNYRKFNGYKEHSKKNGTNTLGGYEIKTTRQLLEGYRKERIHTTGRNNSYESRYAIPVCQPVQYPEKELLIDPYIFGLWLGDGDKIRGGLTTLDPEIQEAWCDYAIQLGLKCHVYDVAKSDQDLKHILISSYTGCQGCNTFQERLKELNVLSNKHIPAIYLRASESQRLELLKGLMDTDGSCSKNGSIEFNTVIPELADNVEVLCRSLGISVRRTTKQGSYKDSEGNKVICKLVHRIRLYTTKQVFKLQRKLNNIGLSSKRDYEFRSSIVGINYVYDAETTCITVDNEDHLFLTDGFTVTHNSEALCSMVAREVQLIQNTEALLLFTSQPDKETFAKKMEIAVTHCTEFFRMPRIDKDWRKTDIRFGFTQKDNTSFVFSRLFMYLTQGGNETEVGAGKTVTFFAYDEIAKALRHGSSIYYEDRIGKIEEVKVGDRIYGKDGKLTTVIGVYPQGKKQLYRFTFRDGRTVDCCGEHLWHVYDDGQKKWRTVNTTYLLKYYKGHQKDKRTGKTQTKCRFQIPHNEPVTYPEKELPIDPYYLGVWLGDGHSHACGAITGIDQEIKDFVADYGNKLGLFYSELGEKDFKISTGCSGKVSELAKVFKKYNLLYNKHIPSDYLYSSFDQRLALLQGLMDTDGTCYKTGIIEFSNTNAFLIKQVEQLARSLGIALKTSKHKGSYKTTEGVEVICKDSYKVRMFTSLPIFRLERKLANYNTNKKTRGRAFETKTAIVDIQAIGEDYATCIRVDNENHLFLTNDFLVTHNSDFLEAYEAVVPAIRSQFGFRCSPFMCFTGGNVDKSADAEKFWLSPTANNIRPYQTDNRPTGFFMGGWYRQDFKKPMRFSDYLGLTTPSELDDLEILVTDFDLANKTLDEELDQARQGKDPGPSVAKKRMYDPRSIEDMFLRAGGNPFSQWRDELKRHQTMLLDTKPGIAGKLVKVNGIVEFQPVAKIPITRFPAEVYDDLDAPIVIYDLPRKEHKNAFYLHIGGFDPYNTAKTDTSSSLGAFYLIRRMYSTEDAYQDTMVASYVGRPDRLQTYLDNIIMLLEFYDATMLHEASNDLVLNHFDLKGKAHLIADTLSLQREINPQTRSKVVKGLPPTPKNQNYWIGCIQEYLGDIVDYEINQYGESVPIYGYTRILDPLLLEELMQFNIDGNFDRIVAFGHALAYNKSLGKYHIPQLRENYDPNQKKEEVKRKNPWSMFNSTTNNLQTKKSPFVFSKHG